MFGLQKVSDNERAALHLRTWRAPGFAARVGTGVLMQVYLFIGFDTGSLMIGRNGLSHLSSRTRQAGGKQPALGAGLAQSPCVSHYRFRAPSFAARACTRKAFYT